MMIVTDGEVFTEVLQKKIDNLKNVVEQGVEIKDDKFVAELKSIAELIAEMAKAYKGINANLNTDKLTKAIKSIELNTNVTIPKIDIPTPSVKVVTNDIYDEYKVSDTIDSDGSTIFHGFMNRTGKWFILRQSGDKNIAYRYATSGVNNMGYEEAIKSPNALRYQYYNEITI